MEVRYHLMHPLVPGRGSRVITKTEDGRPTGEYTAFYRPERGVVTLYPAPKAKRFFGYLPKHEVSIHLLIKSY